MMAWNFERVAGPFEGATGGIGGFSIVEEPKKVTTQRQQPVGKNRSKKSGNKK